MPLSQKYYGNHLERNNGMEETKEVLNQILIELKKANLLLDKLAPKQISILVNITDTDTNDLVNKKCKERSIRSIAI